MDFFIAILYDLKMANLIVIDDLEKTHNDISSALEGTEHRVVDAAYSLSEAQILLTQLALGQVTTDFVLLDGNLNTWPDYGFMLDGGYDFHYIAPEHIQPPMKKRWWHAIAQPVEKPNPHEIVVPYEGPVIAGDGRHLSTVIRKLDLDVSIIGISVDPATKWGPDEYVDYDLTKANLSQLPNLLDEIKSA